MKMIALTLALLCAAFTHAQAQEVKYSPFPQDYDQLDSAGQQKAQQAIQQNTNQYFHSQAYRDALNNFVKINNPADIQSCKLLSIGREKDRNTTRIIKPLLFAYEDDQNPTVGEWEQSVIVTGCRREFNFTIVGQADSAGKDPSLTLKN